MLSMLAVDDGLWSGNFDAADICFLIATILFAIAFVVRVIMKPIPIDFTLVAAGLTAVALAWLLM